MRHDLDDDGPGISQQERKSEVVGSPSVTGATDSLSPAFANWLWLVGGGIEAKESEDGVLDSKSLTSPPRNRVHAHGQW